MSEDQKTRFMFTALGAMVSVLTVLMLVAIFALVQEIAAFNPNPTDVNGDGAVNVLDVQLVVNDVLGDSPELWRPKRSEGFEIPPANLLDRMREAREATAEAAP